MKKVLFKTVMGIAFFCMLFASCADGIKDLYDPEYVIQQYQKNWIDSIGQIDPSQTWNMAKQVGIDVNLDGISNSECEVNVYTANPINSSSKKLAKYTVQGQKSALFDMPKALEYAYVTAKDSRGLVVNGYYKITDGSIKIGKSFTRADETECGVTIGDEIEMGSVTVNGSSVSNEFRYLENVPKVESTPWLFGDYIDIIGKYGVFAENQNNASIYAKELNLKDGVIFHTLEEGEIELTYIYGATQNHNKFGYFYYTDESEISTATRYVYLADARPSTSLRVNSTSGNLSVVADGCDMGLSKAALYSTLYDDEKKSAIEPYTDWSGGWENKINYHLNDEIYGSTYKLVYFDETGKASYTFPEGVHIVFFIYTKEQCTDVFYSQIEENARYGRPNQIISAVFEYKDNLLFGIEDNPYADNDMNDMMFCITGAVGANVGIEDLSVEETKGQEWILACEDLGNTDDFDFNDIVFSVEYVAGETTAIVTPLAAGGTLPAIIKYKSSPVGQEIHEWFGVSTKTMVNTTSRDKTTSSLEVNVGSDFSMTNNMGGFTIDVNNGTTTVAAPAAGAAPQMILVSDADWAWPYERVSIVNAYGQFKNWSENASSNTDWYATPTGKTVDGDYSNSSTEEDENDNTGGEEGDDDVTSETHPEYGVLVAAADLVSGQPIPAKYFANVGESCTITLLSSGNINGNFYGNISYTGMDTGWNNSGIVVITLNATLLEDAKKGALVFNSWEPVLPTMYIK